MLDKREEYVKAVIAETELRKDYLDSAEVNTIYFGGGTPTLLCIDNIRQILDKIRDLFKVKDEAEITIECNPGDLNEEYLNDIRRIGINRLSIGIQSFDDKCLQLLGRRHSAEDAREAVKIAQEAGFDNISIDLIYGIPEQSLKQWRNEISQALQLKVQHISSYCLTYEEGTTMSKMLEKGEIKAVDDETENEMYDLMVKMLTNSGYERYEVSNFALQGYRSKHNSAYWDRTTYLGLGAAAHSFDGGSRQWNKGDLNEYIKETKARNLQPEIEILTAKDVYNEIVMLSLRTAEGLRLDQLSEADRIYCREKAEEYICSGRLELTTDNHLTATTEGINILNLITEDRKSVV